MLNYITQRVLLGRPEHTGYLARHKVDLAPDSSTLSVFSAHLHAQLELEAKNACVTHSSQRLTYRAADLSYFSLPDAADPRAHERSVLRELDVMTWCRNDNLNALCNARHRSAMVYCIITPEKLPNKFRYYGIPHCVMFYETLWRYHSKCHKRNGSHLHNSNKEPGSVTYNRRSRFL